MPATDAATRTGPTPTTLSGAYCPVITPLTADGRLDEDALRRQVDRVVAVGDGVMVLGTSGELPILPTPIADRVVAVAAEHLQGRAQLVCGIGDVGTDRAIANVHRAHRAGVDVVAVTTPYYYPVDDRAMCAHYLDIAEQSEIPLAIYNIPGNTHAPVTRNVVERVAVHPQVIGIKDSGGDRDLFDWLLRTRAETGLRVLQGTDESHALAHWRAGIDGYVSGLENIAPGAMLAMRDAVAAGDDAGADRLQAQLSALMNLSGQAFWLSVLKEGAAMQGIGSGRISRPLPALSGDARAALRATLAQFELLPASSHANVGV